MTASLPPMAMADAMETLREKALQTPDATVNWKYEMRREVQEILPGLYLGPYSALRDIDVLLNENVRNVVLIRGPAEERLIRPKFQDILKTLIIEVSDSSCANIISSLSPFKNFVDGAHQLGGKVLVACACGISRGPAFVVGYVMESFNWTYEKAYQYVQNRRFCINPNDNFKSQLLAYESMYRARQTISHHPYSQEELSRSSIRRKAADEIEDGSDASYLDQSVNQLAHRSKEQRREDVMGVRVEEDSFMQM